MISSAIIVETRIKLQSNIWLLNVWGEPFGSKCINLPFANYPLSMRLSKASGWKHTFSNTGSIFSIQSIYGRSRGQYFSCINLAHNVLFCLNLHQSLMTCAFAMSFKLLKPTPPSSWGKHNVDHFVQWCLCWPNVSCQKKSDMVLFMAIIIASGGWIKTSK